MPQSLAARATSTVQNFLYYR